MNSGILLRWLCIVLGVCALWLGVLYFYDIKVINKMKLEREEQAEAIRDWKAQGDILTKKVRDAEVRVKSIGRGAVMRHKEYSQVTNRSCADGAEWARVEAQRLNKVWTEN